MNGIWIGGNLTLKPRIFTEAVPINFRRGLDCFGNYVLNFLEEMCR